MIKQQYLQQISPHHLYTSMDILLSASTDQTLFHLLHAQCLCNPESASTLRDHHVASSEQVSQERLIDAASNL